MLNWRTVIVLFSRSAVKFGLHVASRPNSFQAKLALTADIDEFNKDICILNDYGSENLIHAYEYLKEQDVTQYFARPHNPKTNPMLKT